MASGPRITFLDMAAFAVAQPASALEFLPHRAVYDLQPAAVGSGATGGRIEGRLVLELAASCERYLLNQRMLTRLVAGGGQQRVNDFRIALSESRDGLELRFTTQHYVDGALEEERDGRASLDGARQGGQAAYRKPEARIEQLPPGTTFPVAFNNRLLASAQAGEQQLKVVLFDGSSDGLRDAISFIGRRQGPENDPTDRHDILDGLPSWIVQTAYYPRGTQAELPEFEVLFRLFSNGVSDDVVLDYGDLRLEGRLINLVALPPPDCD